MGIWGKDDLELIPWGIFCRIEKSEEDNVRLEKIEHVKGDSLENPDPSSFHIVFLENIEFHGLLPSVLSANNQKIMNFFRQKFRWAKKRFWPAFSTLESQESDIPIGGGYYHTQAAKVIQALVGDKEPVE